jgi:hypothetical protein
MMRILEILKSEPDEVLERIIDVHKRENEVKVVKLYEGEPDYEALLDDILEYDKVICWW